MRAFRISGGLSNSICTTFAKDLQTVPRSSTIIYRIIGAAVSGQWRRFVHLADPPIDLGTIEQSGERRIYVCTLSLRHRHLHSPVIVQKVCSPGENSSQQSSGDSLAGSKIPGNRMAVREHRVSVVLLGPTRCAKLINISPRKHQPILIHRHCYRAGGTSFLWSYGR